MMSIERLNLEVPGFDELVSGGIPKGSSVLVNGGPGGGKTTFCLHLAAKAAISGKRVLYMSFEEKRERLLEHIKAFGWDVDQAIADGTFEIQKIDPFRVSRAIEALLAKARGELMIDIKEIIDFIPTKLNPEIIILDSLSAVAAVFGSREEAYRIYVEQLFSFLESTGANSFLISEIELSVERVGTTSVEDFLADGVVSLYNLRQGNQRINALEVVKMRGVQIEKKIVPFQIGPNGIEIFPSEPIFLEA